MSRKLQTGNRNGYQTFRDPSTGQWQFVHRRVVEKKLGVRLPGSIQVHHIDHDKTNNRRGNLVPVSEAVHRELHNGNPDVCFRCGRASHWAADCYAQRDFQGRPVSDPYDW